MARNPAIDAYMATVPGYAGPLFEHLRALVHATIPEIEEGIKWGKPTFLYKGKNLATFAAFKAHAMFAIHGGGRQGEGEAGGGKLSRLADLPGDNVLKSNLIAARERIDAEGTALRRPATGTRTPRPELPVPPEFATALAASPKAAATLAGFAPSHRREYLEWIADAKRPETRDKRIAQAITQLESGLKRFEKYRNC